MRILGLDGLGVHDGRRGTEQAVEGHDDVAELSRNVTGVMDQGVVLNRDEH